MILPFVQADHLLWQGSTGARAYALNRSEDYGAMGANATWITVRSNLSETELPINGIGWPDPTAVRGRTYWYAMKAINEGGSSDLSNVMQNSLPVPTSTSTTTVPTTASTKGASSAPAPASTAA